MSDRNDRPDQVFDISTVVCDATCIGVARWASELVMEMYDTQVWSKDCPYEAHVAREFMVWAATANAYGSSRRQTIRGVKYAREGLFEHLCVRTVHPINLSDQWIRALPEEQDHVAILDFMRRFAARMSDNLDEIEKHAPEWWFEETRYVVLPADPDLHTGTESVRLFRTLMEAALFEAAYTMLLGVTWAESICPLFGEINKRGFAIRHSGALDGLYRAHDFSGAGTPWENECAVMLTRMSCTSLHSPDSWWGLATHQSYCECEECVKERADLA
jgi:hypothetical protein